MILKRQRDILVVYSPLWTALVAFCGVLGFLVLASAFARQSGILAAILAVGSAVLAALFAIALVRNVVLALRAWRIMFFGR